MSLFSGTKKYDGVIGKFEYDPKEFRLAGTEMFANLFYVGKETDGSKIKIPEGIIDCSRMFEFSSITTPPVIPEGVKICDRMFDGSQIQEPPVFPDSVESISNAAFCNCTSLTEINLGAGVMKLGTGVFAGCNDLQGVSFSSASGNDYFVCDDGVIYNSDMDKIIEVLPGRTKDSYFMPATVTDISA